MKLVSRPCTYVIEFTAHELDIITKLLGETDNKNDVDAGVPHTDAQRVYGDLCRITEGKAPL